MPAGTATEPSAHGTPATEPAEPAAPGASVPSGADRSAVAVAARAGAPAAVAGAVPAAGDARARIEEARARIDDLDRRIIALVRERIGVSAEVQAARRSAGGPRLSLAREMQILERYRGALGRPGTELAMLLLELCRGRL